MTELDEVSELIKQKYPSHPRFGHVFTALPFMGMLGLLDEFYGSGRTD